jgi:predicted AAA+ superfamily ATPase
MIIKRERYLNRLIKEKDDTKFVKIITGIRRCGKSTLMRQYADHLRSIGVENEDIFHIDLELYDKRHLLSTDALHGYLKQALRGRRTYLMIDEIQKIEGWESVIRSAMSEFDTDIYLTGSNAYMLSSELATLLSGRCIEVRMLPFSFSEFIEFNGYDRKGINEGHLSAYMIRGSFPLIDSDDDPETVRTKLEGIYNTIVMKDIINRKKDTVRNGPLLDRLVRFVFSTCGSPVSPHSISKQPGFTDSNTVDQYLRLLEEAFIVHRLDRYDLKGKRIFQNTCKYYCADTGMRGALLGTSGTDTGHLLENIVFLELLRRGFEVYAGMSGDHEIEFVAKKGSEIRYYQVTESMAAENVRERELRPLLSLKDNYPKTVISTDRLILGDHRGIGHLNVIDFLLGKD